MKKMTLAIMLMVLASIATSGETVKGTVSCEGKAVAGVVVSDGRTVTLTDAKGRYSLDADKESRFIFISTPSGYISEPFRGENCYYQDYEVGKKVYDFNLIRNPEDDNRHKIIAIADPQVTEANEFPQLRRFAEDISRYVVSHKDRYTFGLCLGDITGYDHSLYEEYNSIMAGNGIRYRYVIGNHDMDNYGRSFETSTLSWEKTYGPTYYSFNVGNVHYIVLNDNFFIGKDWYYIGYLEEKQLRWMEQDLASVGTDRKVVLALHIPTTLHKEDRSDYVFNYGTAADILSNKKPLYEILAPYDALILSGHIHFGNNQVISDRLMELNISALSGAWWCGDVCIDGSPAGFKVLDFDGGKVKWKYIGCGFPEDRQMKLYVNTKGHEGEVIANIWDYDPEWKVEYFEDGAKCCDMERFTMPDPYAAELYKHPEQLKRSWVYAVPAENMFRAKISAEAKSIEVRATDRFGRVYGETVRISQKGSQGVE